MKPASPLIALVAALVLSACSSKERTDADVEQGAPNQAAAPTQTASESVASPTPAATKTSGGNVLSLEGFADLVIGQPVPADSSFRMRGAQASDTCLVYSSPQYQGTYAIVEGGKVRRVTVARDSRIKLIEGIGIGSTEKEVLAAFPGFKAEPHKYIASPGKYLTQPGNDPRLRFEIGEDGRVTDVHVGEKPQLLYVEGCA